MLHDFSIKRVVEFHETDTAQIVHFSNFFKYMEACEHAMFRSLGLSVKMDVDGEHFSFPRVNVSCDFVSPLRFEDEFEVRLVVREKREKAFVMDYIFTRLSGEGAPCRVARGSITIVCVRVEGPGRMRAAPIPAAYADKIEAAPEEALDL
ncbi:MAG: acyl-CoA thioesterase [Planctomycetota bacterium]|jgi:YbgC/YbaW family acyl-CoA thioester hydrolase